MNIKSDTSTGALARTNQQIRQHLEAAEERRQQRSSTERPLRYLDQLITHLERLHLRGLTVVPDSFLPTLNGVKPLLPPTVEPPRRWRRKIAATIDRCFDLQQQLLQVRQSTELSAAA